METPSLSKPLKPRFTFDSSNAELIISTSKAKQAPATPWQVSKHVKEAPKNWDRFYQSHSKNEQGFFKDRHWTSREFEVLSKLVTSAEVVEGQDAGGADEVIIMEVGCGTGAFIWGLMADCATVRFHAFDFSKKGVEQVVQNPKYDASRVNAFVHDLTDPLGASLLSQHLATPPTEWLSRRPSSTSTSTSPSLSPEPNHPDIISCIFVLSALPPQSQLPALRSLFSVIKPGGTLLLRDYALHDQTQLRFHSLPSASYASVPSLLSASEPWYRRGDSTMCYFFTVDEIEGLIRKAAEEEGLKIVGGQAAALVEREMENRKEGWKCGRKFVQGNWTVEKA